MAHWQQSVRGSDASEATAFPAMLWHERQPMPSRRVQQHAIARARSLDLRPLTQSRAAAMYMLSVHMPGVSAPVRLVWAGVTLDKDDCQPISTELLTGSGELAPSSTGKQPSAAVRAVLSTLLGAVLGVLAAFIVFGALRAAGASTEVFVACSVASGAFVAAVVIALTFAGPRASANTGASALDQAAPSGVEQHLQPLVLLHKEPKHIDIAPLLQTMHLVVLTCGTATARAALAAAASGTPPAWQQTGLRGVYALPLGAGPALRGVLRQRRADLSQQTSHLSWAQWSTRWWRSVRARHACAPKPPLPPSAATAAPGQASGVHRREAGGAARPPSRAPTVRNRGANEAVPPAPTGIAAACERALPRLTSLGRVPSTLSAFSRSVVVRMSSWRQANGDADADSARAGERMARGASAASSDVGRSTSVRWGSSMRSRLSSAEAPVYDGASESGVRASSHLSRELSHERQQDAHGVTAHLRMVQNKR